MNCWQHMKCGRQAGGDKAAEMGVCPAFTQGAGEACWLIAGTFCQGRVQGSSAQKQHNCVACDFYKKFDLQHRSHMRTKFAGRA
ncbi:MAG: hypothetical protein Fur0037_12400 [Planctomycetota bacterium]